MPTSKTLIPLTIAGVIIWIWAGSFIFIKLALETFTPMTLAFVRFAIATPVLIAITMYARPSRQAIRTALTREFWLFSFLGLAGVTLLYVFQFYSLGFISATEGSVIINLHAIFAMLLSAAFLKEPLTTRKMSGVFVAFAGLLVITIAGDTIASLTMLEPVGVMLMVAAALCWAAYSVFGKKVLHRYSNQVATSSAFVLGTLFLVPFALSEGRMDSILNPSLTAWGSVLFLAIPSSVVAYLLWNRLIRSTDVTKVLVSLYVIPIPTAILSYIFLGETITLRLVLGAALVIAGVYLTSSSKSLEGVSAVAAG